MTIWDDFNQDRWDGEDALWDTHIAKYEISDSLTLSDAILYIRKFIKDYLIDLLLAESGIKTYTIDTFIQKQDILKNYSLDALLQIQKQASYTIDTRLSHVFNVFLSDNIFSNWDGGSWDEETFWGSEDIIGISKQQQFNLSDVMALSDSIQAELVLIIEKLLDDGMTLSDAIHQGAIEFVYLVDELFTKWDNPDSLWDHPDETTRWGAEGPAHTDSRFFRKFDDSSTISDDIDIQKILIEEISDSLTITDAIDAFLGAPAPPGSIIRIRIDGTGDLIDLFPLQISPSDGSKFNTIKISGGGEIPQFGSLNIGGISVTALFIGNESEKETIREKLEGYFGELLKLEFLLSKEYKEGTRVLLTSYNISKMREGIYTVQMEFKER